MKKNDNSAMETFLNVKKNDSIVESSIEISKAAVGAIVGLAVGGPVGAVVGSVTAPVISLAQNVTSKALERRRNRLESIVEDSIILSSRDITEVLTEFSQDDDKIDDFLLILKSVMEADKSLDIVFKGLLSELIKSKETSKSQRILIIADAIRNFREIHLKILLGLFNAGGSLKAYEISEIVGIPEIELRSVVRDLELRGMIKDLEKRPIEWGLRELGRAVVQFAQSKEEV